MSKPDYMLKIDEMMKIREKWWLQLFALRRGVRDLKAPDENEKDSAS